MRVGISWIGGGCAVAALVAGIALPQLRVAQAALPTTGWKLAQRADHGASASAFQPTSLRARTGWRLTLPEAGTHGDVVFENAVSTDRLPAGAEGAIAFWVRSATPTAIEVTLKAPGVDGKVLWSQAVRSDRDWQRHELRAPVGAFPGARCAFRLGETKAIVDLADVAFQIGRF